jgi:hypothetical protein
MNLKNSKLNLREKLISRKIYKKISQNFTVAINPKSLKNLTPYKQGHPPTNVAKPYVPSDSVLSWQVSCHSKEDLMKIMQILPSLRTHELEEIVASPDFQHLEKVIANALLRDFKGGSLVWLFKILERLYGQARQETTIEVVTEKPKQVIKLPNGTILTL